ncbi:MAG: UDP-N-acetylmuramoyl-tripeptide--D-alanyl-D-alanine ligase [Microlunatus sp.]|nr:UDP-N-acetylmuramoyl-tripeptide--D-alanyl-D-alanine ligase [Microlunatus sp.]MDN5771040.1 UDP-N-acetylmuramoyl-tripeptide--D-alanyl-D-alanine ligase [Microlunatus sp.]MDN5803262.1 UDP-N-acetylmuramoyl-tripeptide--D-alanyl-D-alanine ligase [Microlunatus sp.]
MIPIAVTEAARVLGAELVGSDGDSGATEITALVADSRQAGPGTLFLALPGEHVDGHDFVDAAFAAGATAAVTAHPVQAPGPCLVVADPLVAAGRLARDQVDRGVTGGLLVTAITGSAGKTSTKDLLAHLLETAGPTVAPVGNLNNELGVPLTVCRIDARTRHLVIEMGARGTGHIGYLCTIAPPQVAAVLNVGTAHVGEFGSRAAIANAKGEIIEALPPGGTAVLNADDPMVWAMRDRTSARPVGTGVGAEPRSEDAVWATDVRSDSLGRCSFALSEKWRGAVADSVDVRLGLSGRHQVANAVAAVAMARVLGVPMPAVASALATARPRSRWRMELTERSDRVLVVNDAYNANPESMRSAVDTVAAMLASRPGATGWAVLGDMLELGASTGTQHQALGAYVAEHGLHRLVAVGALAEDLVAGAASAGTGLRAEVAVDSVDAAARVLAELAPGDVVLVKGSRGLALDTVAAALMAADGDGHGHGRDEDST